MGEKIYPNFEKAYNMGDPVFFYDGKKKEWKKGTALVRLGKTVYLRFGNFLRRVPVDNVRPDYDGEVDVEEGYIEPDDEDNRFAEEETSVQEMAKDLDLAEQNKKLKELLKAFQDKAEVDKKTNDNIQKETLERAKKLKLVQKEQEKNKLIEERNQKKKLILEMKEREKEKFPKLGQKILFKVKGSDLWKYGKIVKTFKKTSKYKHLRHIDVEDEAREEYDFQKHIDEWKEFTGDKEVAEIEENDNAEEEDEDIVEEVNDTFFLTEIVGMEETDIDNRVFPVKTIPKHEFHKPEIQTAMEAE